MRTIIIISTLVAVTLAATLPEKQFIPIVRQDSDIGFDGNYHSSFETGNGIRSEEHGTLKNAGSKDASSEVSGKVEYTSLEGEPVYLEYLANEFGFQVKGSHLPTPPVDTNTPPPIPEAIQRSLAYNAAHPEENESEEHQRNGGFRP